jgi:hypothetical protein
MASWPAQSVGMPEARLALCEAAAFLAQTTPAQTFS